jgi:hypothetical protein
VVGVLAPGIGLNAAVFTMLKSMALSPLAGVQRSSQLATVFRETTAGRPLSLSYPDYEYIRDHDQAFTGLMGSTLATVGLGKGRGSRSLFSELVTGNYFQVLGIRAARGRTLLPSDEIASGQLLIIENVVLAVPGAILGVILASQGLPLVMDYVEALAVPRLVFFNVGVDSLVNGFAVIVACSCALVSGFVPALQSSRVDLGWAAMGSSRMSSNKVRTKSGSAWRSARRVSRSSADSLHAA